MLYQIRASKTYPKPLDIDGKTPIDFVGLWIIAVVLKMRLMWCISFAQG